MAPEVLLPLLLFLTAGGVAFLRGGAPERVAAGIIVAWVVTVVLYHLAAGPAGFGRVDPGDLVLDLAELGAIGWLALRANRMWPLWAAAAQLICVSGHFAVFVEPGMRRAYWAMTQIPPFIQVIALVCGAAAHVRRERKWGAYRSWRLAEG